MKIVIIEDEKPAAEKLQKALLKTHPEMDVVTILRSVKESIGWFREQPMPDLIFMDIELTDGSSLDIFEKVSINCPVIFTTAYDEYWQAAFEHNSIDYLMKPIREEKLILALSKYEKLKQYFAVQFKQLADFTKEPHTNVYKQRFLVKRGADYVSIPTADIAYFYAAHKLVCLVEKGGQKFILDQSLADIEKQLDPGLFYRVNRKYILQMNAIKRIRACPKSKLQLEVVPSSSEEIIVSQENAMAFKGWMGK
jgi:two-component system LytT family response regulator